MSDSEVTEVPQALPTEPASSLDRWFDDIATRVGEATGFYPVFAPRDPRAYPRLPRTDLLETPSGFQVITELPGVSKDQLELTVKGTEVQIKANVAKELRSEGPVYLHQERRQAAFERYIELPEPVVAEKATATLREGLLTLDLPKEHPEPVPSEVRVPVQ